MAISEKRKIILKRFSSSFMKTDLSGIEPKDFSGLIRGKTKIRKLDHRVPGQGCVLHNKISLLKD